MSAPGRPAGADGDGSDPAEGCSPACGGGGGGSVPGAGMRTKMSISVMRAALAAAGVPIAGLLERAEFEALYWKLQEGGGDGAACFPSPPIPLRQAEVPRDTPCLL